MTRLQLVVPALFLLACTRVPANSGHSTPQVIVDELLETDRAFAAAAARTDVAGALGPMFAPDVLMPTPDRRFASGPAEAIEVLRANADNQGARLEWSPVRGGISADGLHGFTFGYMTMHLRDGRALPLKYMAYWVKRPEGWRVVAYKRGRRAEGEPPREMMLPAVPGSLVPPVTDSASIAEHRESLAAAEREFSNVAQNVGLGTAFRRHGSADAVNMGGPNDVAFVVGAEAIGDAIGRGAPGPGSPVSWDAGVRVIVASSGDLGVTFGFIRPNAPDAPAGSGAPFFTIWRRESFGHSWRYIAE